MRTDYLEQLLHTYYPLHFFAVFRAHELYNVEPFIELLSPPVLDLGCGDGVISKLLFGHPLDYGIDISGSATKSAKATGAYKVVFSGDAHTMPLDSNSLGGIFSNCVLEHIPEMPSLIAEISRLLKPGAYFVATCLSPYYYTMNPIFRMFDKRLLKGLRRRMISQENKLHNHVSVLGIDEYRTIFAMNEMALEAHRYYATEPVANFCSKWDTTSKYIVPFPVMLTHSGALTKYLLLRYAKLSEKETTIKKWYEDFYALCYDRNDSNEVGVGQIIVAKKC